MTPPHPRRRDWSDAAARAGAILALAWCCVLPTFLLDPLDLSGSVGVAAYWVAEVGGTRRRWLGLLVVVLAVAVCWSRPALRVHSPWDVTVGAAQGILLGLLTFAVSWRLLPDDT